jgi:hypothetical protein
MKRTGKRRSSHGRSGRDDLIRLNPTDKCDQKLKNRPAAGVDEGSVQPCVIGGKDYGQLLYAGPNGTSMGTRRR